MHITRHNTSDYTMLPGILSTCGESRSHDCNLQLGSIVQIIYAAIVGVIRPDPHRYCDSMERQKRGHLAREAQGVLAFGN